jgi:hypothetical protein
MAKTVPSDVLDVYVCVLNISVITVAVIDVLHGVFFAVPNKIPLYALLYCVVCPLFSFPHFLEVIGLKIPVTEVTSFWSLALVSFFGFIKEALPS